MRFSLILATIGRTEEPGHFLASLRTQHHRDFELIVVDQNPDDRLVPVLDPYTDEFPILHLRSERGLSKARNLGLKRATGDIVTFPDDDCWYPPNLLGKVADFLLAHPELDAITGCTIDAGGKISMGRFDTEPGPVSKATVLGRGIETALFLRADSARGTWFDEELGLGSGTPWGAGEGTDYLLELLERGASMYYDPGLGVIHPPLMSPYSREGIRKAYSYGCGIGRMLKKHKMPLWLKAKWLYRPLGGAALSLLGLKLTKARYHWSVFKGRLRGMLS